MIPHLSRMHFLAQLQDHGLHQHQIILKAISQAVRSHMNQKRDDGSSYLEQHIYPVASTVITFCDQTDEALTPLLICGALLHDTLEDDNNLSAEHLHTLFGEQLTTLIIEVTKPCLNTYPGTTTWDKRMARDKEYLTNMKKKSREARIIKLADRLNNLRCLGTSRIAGKQQRYVRDTKRYYVPLAEEFPWFLQRIKKEMKKY
ncbi:HD domain-containing protein [Candidatus Woesearchaeota archaeon]|nr:HD domain-containing protein [Candidatus Woesearchaeota archaeon]